MNANHDPQDGYFDKVVILFLFALLLLVSPLVNWWAADDSPWYMPYLLWAAIIGLTALLQRRHRSDGI